MSSESTSRTYRRAITYGTYDLLHIGHVNLLRRIRGFSDHLIVAVSTDAFNAIKHKVCVQPYAERAEIVAALRYVDLVIPEDSWEQKRRDVVNYGIDVVVMGDDWAGKFDDLADLCDVVYLPRTEGVSTTMRKTDIIARGESLLRRTA
ncbi:adenylyltransferase/cytidyltransferase family protein [Oharaeibacter diazotrophicus]|uniref:Glycerol-3-phosphate cytidylyltransferase n=1 Tax=Oharaeibacter diazotrophicus TaxID=1920512 RepID=A0A4R6RN86_9HYPH|nr:adenylyltransferase/cytidyltransferase family protein [Oharaeibacter diazotrophicus]TDP87645.1 glycerol-3-phosphate cytidylyltransferase [Oharaeibacter diazotrophicus]BBE74772.1 glycerol-3-phosphate cytidylyltransferase [Pleomorphomonas sp. SM30]GLS77154.1 hypothetical protein GCM10007904_24910 [Oharaeibacter diazotrophicus]